MKMPREKSVRTEGTALSSLRSSAACHACSSLPAGTTAGISQKYLVPLLPHAAAACAPPSNTTFIVTLLFLLWPLLLPFPLPLPLLSFSSSC